MTRPTKRSRRSGPDKHRHDTEKAETAEESPVDGGPGRCGGDSPPPGDSRYRRAASPPPAPTPPPRVRIELVVVDGLEGRELGARQAVVIREVLRWFAQHPARTPEAT